MRKFIILGIQLFAVFFFFFILPRIVDYKMNGFTPPYKMTVSDKAVAFHKSLEHIADFHADSLLWNRDLLTKGSYGHVDIPRLLEGNVALQGFGIVTRVPLGMNIQSNRNDTYDLITALSFADRWGLDSVMSLKRRALHQATRFHQAVQNLKSKGKLRLIGSKEDLEEYIQERHKLKQYFDQRNEPLNITAGFLTVEGSHCIEDDINNINELYDAGVRVMSIAHFFDNQLGGSAHGTEKGGLTPFGFSAVQRMQQLGILIDLAHCSTAVIDEVLKMATLPVVVSHTGVQGTCNNPRNLDDTRLKKIAAKGGVVSIGFFDAVTCGSTPKEIGRSIRYAANLIGADHVSLGSDFDGAVKVPFAVDNLNQLTQVLLDEGFTEKEITLIMGENVFSLLRKYLPGRHQA